MQLHVHKRDVLCNKQCHYSINVRKIKKIHVNEMFMCEAWSDAPAFHLYSTQKQEKNSNNALNSGFTNFLLMNP